MEQETISKIEIALIQLNTAVDLFIHDNNYICAATLAGASEEILGRYIEHERKGTENSFSILCRNIKENSNVCISEKEIGHLYVNLFKNEIKHFKGKEKETVFFDIQTEAISLISRATTNLWIYNKSTTEKSLQFLKWIYKNRADLVSKIIRIH